MEGMEKTMKYDGIIFDLDGTLWDATEVELKAINDVIINEYDVDTITIEQLKNVMGVPLQEAASILFHKEKQKIGIEILEKSGILLDTYIKENRNSLLYDKVRETLNTLNKEHNLYIVSNCKNGYIESDMWKLTHVDYYDDPMDKAYKYHHPLNN